MMRKTILKTFFLICILIFTMKYLYSQDVLITEIMYRPSTFSCEYIELYNNSREIINLKNWKIGDMRNSTGVEFVHEDFFLPDKRYLVIAEDSSFFDIFSTEISRVIIFNKLPALNNDGDLIILKNSFDEMIDSVLYSDEWGSEVGRSLERKTIHGSSNDPSNWSLCADFSGGTPGKQNSMFFVSDKKNVNIELSPDPFSPDSDGFEDELHIKIELPFDRARTNIKIFDRYGRFINTLLNGYEIGQKFSFNWNGKSENGNLVKTGIYILLIEILSEKEKFFESYKKTVAVFNE